VLALHFKTELFGYLIDVERKVHDDSSFVFSFLMTSVSSEIVRSLLLQAADYPLL
jgi:hypothetical protein